MSGLAAAGLFGGLTLLLIALRVHIGVAMLTGGAAGYAALAGWGPLSAYLKHAAYGRFSVYDLSVVPLFLLMGAVAARGGLSRRLFDAACAFLGHRRGGLAMGAVGACAAFGAICGSSLATAAAMGQTALPELRRRGYAPALAAGTLAAGGTLGILVPPSVVLAVYGVLTEQNIGRLFVAAAVPAVIAVVGYLIVIALYVRLFPGSGPAGPVVPWPQRWAALRRVWPILSVFLIVIGGIYGGVFTPTEAAAVGVFATVALTVSAGAFSLQSGLDALLATAESTAMIFFILLGADVLNAFLALTQTPTVIAQWAQNSGLPPLTILFAILLIYLALGCVMDSLSMILLTVPIFFPVVMGLDFWGLGRTDKAIWFGVLALMVVEIGLVTPPVGMNVFIIHGLAKDTPIKEVFRGVAPFLLSDILRTVVLVFYPGLTLWLTHL